MTRYAAFLRGVNVGGVNLKMAQVAKALTDAGLANVRTILASGNVLLESDKDAEAVRATAESALRKRFGYDAWVLVYDADTVRAIIDAYPFEPEVEGHHSYVTLVAEPDVLDELAALPAEPTEKIARGDGVIYWQVPKGDTLDSTIGKTMGKKRYKSSTTTRNLRTLAKTVLR
ncbi:DUF1697 domain-containing protein [Mycobacterium branderi]|uniref:Pyridoxamine 5'-phosphate oxidase n=1 Tax=Mycobacterium branderi TaxID=43348 RepID=A0A7I7W4X7_9MYCO|nr:DUF1697 domain-containing protein [Mycobacterium branderi]MCV7235940.1 DUF1697 domain-containing protein [Mycobacterium branderi]ORA34710.1 pyridoxamine 5-phosphate oxidase [Mycobacterium branderi]BBZ12614.1 pyridoxamine 5'-phosphate oxidase [Mycobacterium branderi]